MPEPAFYHYLNASLIGMAMERPEYLRRLANTLGVCTVLLAVDGTLCTVLSDGKAVQVTPVPQAHDVSVTTSRQAILDLVDGRSDLLALSLSDRLVVCGYSQSLAGFYDGLAAFVDGAVRCEGQRRLLSQYRRGEVPDGQGDSV